MYIAKIENRRGDVLTLTQNESEYQVERIDGLNPPSAQINMLNMANIDGAKFNSSKLNTREIVIMIRISGGGDEVEERRHRLYRYFPTKDWCKFYYTNNFRDVWIEGYVNTVEVSPFDNKQLMQISILCPQSYFKSAQLIIDDISKQLPLFEFPFSFGSKGATNVYVPEDPDTDDAIPFSEIDMERITNVYNDSESECGMTVEIDVIQPITSITLQNTDTGEFLQINHSFNVNDKIIIVTNLGQKSIHLIRDGIDYNLFTSLVKGSTFLQLNIGNNFFSFTLNDGADDSSVHIVFKHHTIYRGV